MKVDFQEIPYDVNVMDDLIERKIHCRDCELVKEILRLRFIKGKSFKQIADATYVSEITVGRKIHKYGDPLLLEIANMIGFCIKSK